MLYKITQLKAPWPASTVVGDIVDMDTLPAWAVGKCQTATDSDGPTVEFEKPEPMRDLAAELATAQEQLEMAKRLAATSYENLQADLVEVEAKLAEALAKSDELAAQIAKRAADDALLPPVDSGEGEGVGQPLPVIDDEPVKPKGKHK